jgi:hypothetical protein
VSDVAPSPATRSPFSRAVRVQVVILCLLLFAAGILTGFLAQRALADRMQVGLTDTHRVFFEQFARDFALTEAQRRKLCLVLEEKAREKRIWWSDFMQQPGNADKRGGLLEIDRKADRRIREILTPAQRRTYESELARQPGS